MKYWQYGLLLAAGTYVALRLFSETHRGTDRELQSLIQLIGRELKQDAELPTGRRSLDNTQDVLVIPDIHGDTNHFLRSLWLGVTEVNKVIITFDAFSKVMLDAAKYGMYPERPLAGESTLLVQVGDVVDRGPDSILCLRILWSVERVIGWSLVSLYGNHEVMSSTGVRQEYIHESELSDFGSLADRYVEFGPGHPIWDKILSSSLGMAVVDSSDALKSTLFVHAGVEPIYLDAMNAGWTVDSINVAIRDALSSTTNLKEQELMVNNLQSPIWTRMFAEDPDSVVCDTILPIIKEKLNINRVVIGHTPQEDHQIKSRCNGQIFLTDFGMSRWLFDDEGMSGLLHFKVGADTEDFESIMAIHYDPWTFKVKTQKPVPVTVTGQTTAPEDSSSEGSEIVHPRYLSNISSVLVKNQSNFIIRAIYQDPALTRTTEFDGVIDCHPPADLDRLRDLMTAHVSAMTPPPNWYPVEVSHVKVNGQRYACMLMAVPESVKPLSPLITPEVALAIRESVEKMHVLGLTLNPSHIRDVLVMFGFDTDRNEVHMISVGSTTYKGYGSSVLTAQRLEMDLINGLVDESKIRYPLPDGTE